MYLVICCHKQYILPQGFLGLVLGVAFLSQIVITMEFASAQTHQNPFERDVGFAPSIQALAATEDGRIFAGSFGQGVFVSTNRGKTWTTMNSGLKDRFILCLTVDQEGLVYAGTIRGGIYRIKADGKKWESISQGLKRVEVKSLLAHRKGLYAGTGRGVYQWQEAQQMWIVVAKGLDQILVSSLLMMDNQRLYAGTAGNGVQWLDTAKLDTAIWQKVESEFIDAKERLRHNHVRILAKNEGGALFVGTQDGGIHRSTDLGKTWHVFGRSLPNDSIRGIVSTSDGVLVATGRGVYKASISNAKWTAVNTGLTELALQAMMMTEDGELFAGTSAGVFRSKDYGEHWVNVSEGLGLQFSMPRPFF